MAEQLTGTVYSYNLTVETPIDIDDMIYMLTPVDLPMLGGVNSNGFPVLPSSPASDTTFYWLEDEILLPRGTTNEALDNSETVIDMVAGHETRFAAGDGIRIDDEIMIVASVDTTNHQLTVARGSAGTTNTTAATHATGAEVIGLGSMLAEGLVGATNFRGRDKYSNVCQITSKQITMSATEQLIRKYGVPSELARQSAHAMSSALVSLEQLALYGVKHVTSDYTRRQTGGLAYFVDGTVDSTADWLTVTNIENHQQTLYDLGGEIDMIVARPKAFQALNNTNGSERVQTVTIDDARRGRRQAQVVLTEFGEVQLVRNRHCKVTDAFGFKQGSMKVRKFRPMQIQKLAKTNDTDSHFLVCEQGFEVKGADHMVRWTGLDTGAVLPSDLV